MKEAALILLLQVCFVLVCSHKPVLVPNLDKTIYETLLSVDGGGVRAVIPLTILISLEDKIKHYMVQNRQKLVQSGIFSKQDLMYMNRGVDAFEIQLADFFDFAAGVSAGSIVVGYIVTKGETIDKDRYDTPQGSPRTGLQIFTEYAGRIFDKSTFRLGLSVAKYSNEGIEEALQEIYKDVRISDIKRIRTMISSFELENSRAIAFSANLNRYGHLLLALQPTLTFPGNQSKAYSEGKMEDPDIQFYNETDFKLWEVIRCSSAAPTTFPAYHITSVDHQYNGTCVDGAVYANNLDMYALASMAINSRQDFRNIAVLSLGQGVAIQNLAEGRSLDRGLLNWAGDLLTILLDATMELQEVLMDAIYYLMLGAPAPQYLRIQLRQRQEKDNEGLPPIDDVEAIPELIQLGEKLALQYDEYLDQFIHQFLLGTEDNPLTSRTV
eukprot:TRINITY_DN27738_c0_g1_i2.p1 TRINITY_DN27738_c0_g1~~TRINITY_DN27738_c0_g1_i2.p1  ORF type:complete len:439 (-),score=48.90 TRINITY_DN27738_c0_g1_i2:262-1578(-)